MKQTKKEKKNVDELKSVLDKFQSKDDSLLAVFAIENSDEAGVMFTGKTRDVTEGIYQILKRGFERDCDDAAERLAMSVIASFAKIMSEGNYQSVILAQVMSDVTEIVMKRILSKMGNDDSDGDKSDDFDPDDEECKKCEDFADCLTSYCKKNHINLKPKREKPKEKKK